MKIKKCPFCGNEPLLITSYVMNESFEEEPTYFCRCKSCGASLKHETTKEEAIRNWNRRNTIFKIGG